MKSGGNDFHGTGSWEQTSHKLQSSNVDAALAAQGITAGNELRRRFDGAWDTGGRLIRDKLWFYSAVRHRVNDETVLQLFKPDGSQAVATDAQFQTSHKISYQMTPSQRLIGFDNFAYLWKQDTIDLNTAWEARSVKTLPERSSKLGWQGVFGNSLVASWQIARWRVHVDYLSNSDKPERYDIFTLKTSGTAPSAGNVVNQWRLATTKGSIGWFHRSLFWGDHEFKAGYDDIPSRGTRSWLARGEVACGADGCTPVPGGDYRLEFNNGVPYQFLAYNFPTIPINNVRTTAIYGADKWAIGRKLSLNLGVRWARDNGYVPAQCQAAGTFVQASCIDKIQARIWYSWSPGLYAAYDVMGDGKTAVKGGWGRFSDWRLDDVVRTFNPLIPLQTTYRWRDLNGNGDYDPGEVNLDVNGPDFISRTGKGNRAIAKAVVNPHEPQTKEDQFSLSLEHELMANFGVRVTGLYSRRFNIIRVQNLLRGPELYTIANTRPDPGPDGRVGTADDPGKVAHLV